LLPPAFGRRFGPSHAKRTIHALDPPSNARPAPGRLPGRDGGAGAGIRGARIYSHGIGPYLHEPGPLLGLPWEQVNTGTRGDVRLVPNSTFTAELSTAAPVPEWGGLEYRQLVRKDGDPATGGAMAVFSIEASR